MENILSMLRHGRLAVVETESYGGAEVRLNPSITSRVPYKVLAWNEKCINLRPSTKVLQIPHHGSEDHATMAVP